MITSEQQRELAVWLFGLKRVECYCDQKWMPETERSLTKSGLVVHFHEVPPPDLTADSAYPAIIKGLLKPNWSLHQWNFDDGNIETQLTDMNVEPPRDFRGCAPTIIESVLQAAYAAYLRDKP